MDLFEGIENRPYSVDSFDFDDNYDCTSSSTFLSDSPLSSPQGECDTQSRPWRRKRRNSRQQVHQRHAANLRERRRMQSINDAFEGLRAHIPTLPYEKRLSKVDTLRLAIGYISFLTELVSSDRSPAEVLQNPVPEPPPKVFISSSRGFNDSSPTVHSISWSMQKENPSGVMVTKLWTPEDPRCSSNKQTGLL